MTSKSPKPKGGKHRVCVFCEQGDICQDTYGKLLSKAGVTAHYFCMLFSSGLSQNGKSEKQGILGFLQSDILKEVKRGSRLRCSYCRKVGATIGCVIKNCKKMFHLGCGRANSTLHQFFGTFSSFCPAHRVKQDVPSDDDPSIVCSICMNTVTASPSNDTIRAPCCRKYWYHRDCIQRYAMSAGLYFFKCPLCNNKDEFQDEMLTMGIYIPDQDASWEKEPHAFQELLERYSHCDAPVCKCVEGRNYDKEGSKWEIILCDFCGSHGAHVACSHLEKLGKHDICHSCKEVDEKTREEEYLLHSPYHKRKSLELLQLELSSSPDQSKGASPYPGPSDVMRKVGLPSQQASSSTRGKKKSAMKKGKRLASPEMENRPDLKKPKLNGRRSATVTSTMVKGRQSGQDLLSPTTSSQSSEESSDDDVPIGMSKTKLSKMALESAWDIRRRKRLENKKRLAEKKEKKKNNVNNTDLDKPLEKVDQTVTSKKKRHSVAVVESESTVENTDKKRMKGVENIFKVRKGNTNKKNALSDSEKDEFVSSTDSDIKNTPKETHKQSKVRLFVPAKEDDVKEKVKQKRSSFGASAASGSGLVKNKQGKKRSLENNKTQTTLTSWLKQKSKDDVIETIKTEPAPVSSPEDKKKPVVIEWKGKQLIIRSPKVVLKRSRSKKQLKMKPKNLEIDMTDAKGCSDWNRDIDLLSNLEADVRVTRKMIDIDQLGTKNETNVRSLVSLARCKENKEIQENILSCIKNEVDEGNTKFAVTQELNNNKVLKSYLSESTGVLLPAEGKLRNEMHKENERVTEKLSEQTKNKMEESPARNLRERKPREEMASTTLSETALAPANVLKFYGVKRSPEKHTVHDKTGLHSSPKSADLQTDSPAKNLRHRMKRNDQKTNVLQVLDNSFTDICEKENQQTSGKEKELIYPLPLETSSSCVKESKFGTVILENMQPATQIKTKATDSIAKLKRYKPMIPHPDSPAKNLRKRSTQSSRDLESTEEIGEGKSEDMETQIKNSVLSNNMDRLIKYKPQISFFNVETVAKEKSSTDTMDTAKIEELDISEEAKGSDLENMQNFIWYFEGTRQLDVKTTAGMADIGCENTCPNPKPADTGASQGQIENTKTYSPKRKSLTLDDILEERLAEINKNVPAMDTELKSPEELCNTVVSLSPSYYTKFRRSCSRSESFETVSSNASSSEFHCENGALVLKGTIQDQRNQAMAFPQSRGNLEAVRNKAVAKLRSSPRSKNSVPSQTVQNHVSDKLSMAEYYGLNTEHRQKRGSVTVEDFSDIVQMPSLINAGMA